MSSDTPRTSRLRVLIVDPHEISRAAIRALLRTEGLDVVADVPSVEQALWRGVDASPDIAVIDLGGDVRSAVAAARALSRLPSLPAVVLTSSGPVSDSLDGVTFIAKPDICATRLRLAMRAGNQPTEETNMSMQAYLDNISAKTGKSPEEFVQLARAEGLLAPGVKAGQIVAWLKDGYGLGHGHAMAIVATIKKQTTPESSGDEKVTSHFRGKKSTWRPVYDELIREVGRFGPDTDVDPGASYLSLRKAGRKFAIVQVTADRLDLGIKLKGVAVGGRFESAGSWNSMVTHRVRIHAPQEIDAEVLEWLERAYSLA